MLSVIMLSDIMLSVIMLSVIMLSVVMLSVIMLSGEMLNKGMLTGVILSIMASYRTNCKPDYFQYAYSLLKTDFCDSEIDRLGDC